MRYSKKNSVLIETTRNRHCTPYVYLIWEKVMQLRPDYNQEHFFMLTIYIRGLDMDKTCKKSEYNNFELIPFRKLTDDCRTLSSIIYCFIFIFYNGLYFFRSPHWPLSMEPLVQSLYRSQLFLITGISVYNGIRSKK